MQAPPENENPAPLGGGNGALRTDDRLVGTIVREDIPTTRPGQGVLTPVPAGPQWRLKSLHGEVVELLPAIFASRLEALIAAVRLAKNSGARVLP